MTIWWARMQRPTRDSSQNAYLLAGLTEHWRATRQFAACMYLAYLDGEKCTHIYTNDNFKNVKTLEFQPYFEDFMGQAFKPLGVNLDFWDPKLQTGTGTASASCSPNDTDEALTGKLTLTLEPRAGSGKRYAGRNRLRDTGSWATKIRSRIGHSPNRRRG